MVFTITPAAPTLTSIAPVAGNDGVTVPVVLTGANLSGGTVDPIAGVTPIEYMLKEVRRPRRGPDPLTGTARSDAPAGQQRAENAEVRRMLAEAAAEQKPWWRQLLPTPPRSLAGRLYRSRNACWIRSASS